MTVFTIDDFRKGKQVTRGRPTPTEPFRVTVVTRDEIDSFLGARSARERTRHLRALRDLGVLVCNERRLTQRVRIGDGRRRCYVFRGPADAVPWRRRRSVGVSLW